MRRYLGALASFALVASMLAQAPAAARPQVMARTTGGAPATAGPPQDYTKVKGLSSPRYKTRRDEFMVEMEDGVEVYVEVVRPRASGRYPVVLELSPYHGTLADRDGTRILPGPKGGDGQPIGLTGYFAPRGYAVVIVDLRGTGRSQGCLDHLGPDDASDAKEIVEWAASRPWSNGRVGMTGHSYVGSTPQLAAAQNPKGLVTIVPSAGLAAMYHHKFQMGVPYWLQWAGPLFAYAQLATERHLPGEDNFGNDMQYFGCGWTTSTATTGESWMSGAEHDWDRERDHREGVTRWKGTSFVVHGVHDQAARIAAIDWFNQRRNRRDKAWIGQWDHGSGRFPNDRTCEENNPQPCRNDQWTLALHAWFDRHLMGRKVPTGPPTEVFLNNGRVFTSRVWPPRAAIMRLFPQADGGLTSRPGDEDSASYVADPRGFFQEHNTGRLVFQSDEFRRDTLIVGIPRLRLTASVTNPRSHVIASLYEISGNGSPTRIGRQAFAIQPELREGIDSPQPVIPGEVMQMPLEGMAQAHVVSAGSKLALVISSSHPDKVPTFAAGSAVTVHTGGDEGTVLRLPVVPNARLWADPMPRRG